MRPIALTLLSAMLTLSLAACKETAPAAGPADGASGPTPGAPAPAAAPAASAKDAFRSNMDAFAQARSYHATMSMAGGPMGEMKSDMDYVAPDRYRMTMTMGGQPMEVIMIGGDSYLKMGGNWTKNPGPPQETPKWDQELKKSLDAAVVQDLGEEALNGVQTRKYQVKLTEPAPTDTTTWFGPDGLPVQVVTSVPANGQTMTSTITYSRYNDPAITIEAPL